MGKFDDSFGIGDLLPTNYELGLVEEDDDDSEVNIPEQQPDTRRKRPPKPSSVNSSPQQQQQPPQAEAPVVEGIEHDHDVVSIHGRWFVVLVLCLSAAGMGYVTFSYIARNEREEFEATVSDFGNDGHYECTLAASFATSGHSLLTNYLSLFVSFPNNYSIAAFTGPIGWTRIGTRSRRRNSTNLFPLA